jgi:hypothetical protein
MSGWPTTLRSRILAASQNLNSSLCLSVPGASKTGAVGVNQYYCGPGNGTHYPDQYWMFIATGDTYDDDMEVYEIVNQNSGDCLSVPGASTAQAVQINQYPCGGYPDQYWAVGEAFDFWTDESAQEIVNVNSGLCMSVPGASTAATAIVNQYPCGAYPDQYWWVQTIVPV